MSDILIEDLMVKQAAEIQARNTNFVDDLRSGEASLLKRAADMSNSYTRLRLRELAWTDLILPPQKIDRTSLSPWMGVHQGVYLQEMEMDTPLGTTIPFNTNGARHLTIQQSKYPVIPVIFNSPVMMKDVRELATSKMDIRQVVMDQLVKDLCALLDYEFMKTVNFLLGERDSINAITQNVHYRHIPGGITPSTLAEAEKIIPRAGSLGWGLETKLMLINNITVKDFLKWNIITGTSDFVHDLLKNGVTKLDIHGYDWIVSIKKRLIPEGSMFMFTSPDFLGVNIILEDVTITIKQEKQFIQFDGQREQGVSIGNAAGVARADFYR